MEAEKKKTAAYTASRLSFRLAIVIYSLNYLFNLFREPLHKPQLLPRQSSTYLALTLMGAQLFLSFVLLRYSRTYFWLMVLYLGQIVLFLLISNSIVSTRGKTSVFRMPFLMRSSMSVFVFRVATAISLLIMGFTCMLPIALFYWVFRCWSLQNAISQLIDNVEHEISLLLCICQSAACVFEICCALISLARYYNEYSHGKICSVSEGEAAIYDYSDERMD